MKAPLGRIYSPPICFWFYLTFNSVCKAKNICLHSKGLNMVKIFWICILNMTKHSRWIPDLRFKSSIDSNGRTWGFDLLEPLTEDFLTSHKVKYWAQQKFKTIIAKRWWKSLVRPIVRLVKNPSRGIINVTWMSKKIGL